MNDILRI